MKSPSANLLVGQDWVALQVSVEKCCSGTVVFTKYGAVYIMEPVPGDQLVSARCTGEALEVVNVSLRPHDHFTGRNGLTTRTACSSVPEQPDVVGPAEDHAALAVARGADLPQLSLTAGALQAARVPVPLHGEQQEPVRDSAPAAGTRAGHTHTARDLAVHHHCALKILQSPESFQT